MWLGVHDVHIHNSQVVDGVCGFRQGILLLLEIWVVSSFFFFFESDLLFNK